VVTNMRRFLENLCSDTADVVLLLGDWIYGTFGPVLGAIIDYLFSLTMHRLTQLVILCILLVMVML